VGGREHCKKTSEHGESKLNLIYKLNRRPKGE
jgi:hypothetical protein